MVDKVIRDGRVAVLVSPGYGAGWSTWADKPEKAVFSPEIVIWVESGKPTDVRLKNEDRWEEEFGYLGGIEDLEIEWLELGTRFTVDEYDGSERLTIISREFGRVA